MFPRLLLAALCATVLPAVATAGGGMPANIVEGEIRSGWITESGTRMAALHLRLAPGWKTYWRSPGDTGIPPSFSWDGSDNLRGVSYHWPSPRIFDSFGTRTIGYKGELVLPIELHPVTPGQPIRLRGKVDLGVCDTICMPAHLTLDANLEGAGAADPAIQNALANAPLPANRAGVEGVTCDVAPISDGIALEATIRMPRLSGDEVALVETGDPRVWVAEPAAERKGNELHVRTELVPPIGTPMALDRREVRFTVIGSKNAVDIRGCASN